MTKTQAETNIKRAANFAYAALLFTLFGWGDLEIFLLRINAGIHGQLLTVASGLGLSTLVWAPVHGACRSRFPARYQ